MFVGNPGIKEEIGLRQSSVSFETTIKLMQYERDGNHSLFQLNIIVHTIHCLINVIVGEVGGW